MPRFINEISEFKNLVHKYHEVFVPQACLPNNVFQRKVEICALFDYGMLASDALLKTLSKLSRTFCDTELYVMSLDPDAAELTRDHYGLAVLESSEIESQFWSRLGAEKPEFPLLGVMNTGVVWSSSREWGIYFDRESWELGILGIPRSAENLINESDAFVPLEDYKDFLIGAYAWKKDDTAQAFLKSLEKHYGPLGIK